MNYVFTFDFGAVVGFIGGGALIWFGKTKIQQLVIGANALSQKLHAEADKIKAAV